MKNFKFVRYIINELLKQYIVKLFESLKSIIFSSLVANALTTLPSVTHFSCSFSNFSSLSHSLLLRLSVSLRPLFSIIPSLSNPTLLSDSTFHCLLLLSGNGSGVLSQVTTVVWWWWWWWWVVPIWGGFAMRWLWVPMWWWVCPLNSAHPTPPHRKTHLICQKPPLKPSTAHPNPKRVSQFFLLSLKS